VWIALWLAQWRMLRDGPSSLPDSSLVNRFGGWFKVGQASCPTARSRRFHGWFGQDRPGGWPGGTVRGDSSLDDCFTGKIR